DLSRRRNCAAASIRHADVTLSELNALAPQDAERGLLRCCGSGKWASAMTKRRPFENEAALFNSADDVWSSLKEKDWREAFAAHPRIGERANSAWSNQEQAGVSAASRATMEKLTRRNVDYEKRFDHVFLICATGKSADEMLAALEKRINNDPATELRVAAAEQAKITRLRLEK